MKLPEFNQQRKMNLNMTSSLPTVDRSREFQAQGQIAGQINQFSEQLESKRRAANIQTFAFEEKQKTASDWAADKSILNIATNEDGTFDFDRAREVAKLRGRDTKRWDSLQAGIQKNEKNNGSQYNTSDQVVGEWWKTRVQEGAGNANNSDQASAYISEVKETSLAETVKSQIAYNVKRASYTESIRDKAKENTIKDIGASNTLIVSKDLTKSFRAIEAGYMSLRGVRSDEHIKKKIEAARHETAVQVLTQTNRLIAIEKQKPSSTTPAGIAKMKEIAIYGIEFVNGIVEGSAASFDYGSEATPAGKRRKAINFSGKEDKNTTSVTNYKKQEGRKPQSAENELDTEEVSTQTIKEDLYEIDPSVVEMFNPDALKEHVIEEAKKPKSNTVAGAPLAVEGSIRSVGSNIFGKTLTPPEQQKWLMRFTTLSISAGVQDLGMGVMNMKGLTKEISSGDFDPMTAGNKAVSGANKILDKVLNAPDKVYSQGAKLTLAKEYSNGFILGSLKNQIPTITREQLMHNLGNLDKIVEDRRVKLIEDYPQTADFMPEGVELIDRRMIRTEVIGAYQKKLLSISTNAASYYIENVPTFAAQNEQVIGLLQNGSPEAPAYLSKLRQDIKTQAAKDGKVSNAKTIPPLILEHFINQLASIGEVWDDPKNLQATTVIKQLQGVLGTGADYYSGMVELANASKKANVGSKYMTGSKLSDLLHITAATGDSGVVQRFIDYNTLDAARVDKDLAVKGVTRGEIGIEVGKNLEDYRTALVSNDRRNTMAKEQYQAVKKFITDDIVDRVAYGKEETSWYNILSSRFTTSSYSSDKAEATTIKISKTILGATVSEDGNTVLIPNAVMQQRDTKGKTKYPQMPKRVAEFLDNAGSAKAIKYFLTESHLEPILEVRGVKTPLYNKYSSILPKRLRTATEQLKTAWMADRYREEVSGLAQWRTDTNGLALVYLPNADDTGNYRGVIDNETNKPITHSWEAIHNLKPYKNFNFHD